MNIRMKRRYEYEEAGVRRVLPADWMGDLDDKIAGQAVKEEAAEEIGADGRPVPTKPAKKAEEPKA